MRGIFASFIVIFSLCMALLLFGCLSGQKELPQSKTATAIFHTKTGNWAVSCDVAQNEYEWARGLMFRQSLAEGQGMIFMRDFPGEYSFYMKNMLFPLDVIYVMPNMKVGKVRHDFKPCETDPCEIDFSPKNTLYVIEVPAGWAKKYDVTEGVAVSLGNA